MFVLVTNSMHPDQNVIGPFTSREDASECDAITDCESKADADWIVAEFVKRSGLKVEV